MHQAKAVVGAIMAEVSDVKAKGQTLITVESLETYLKGLDDQVTREGPLDQVSLAFLEHEHQSSLEMFKATISASQAAVKSALLTTGGGGAALLAFASSAWSKLKPEGLNLLADSILLMGLAVLLAALTSAFSYLSQYWYDEDGKLAARLALGFHLSALASVFVAYCFFAVAAWKVSLLIHQFNVVPSFPVG